ncbi:hypothetical protein [Endozoicomonas acroporae]|uniref:hypothetical protein n=1 Tax=Endozoicomonas acroporae TaxID=1701104 RepID=UPI0013D88853|nr:hypothetical protein [Endozoicomonas acroporae]
MRLSVTLSSRCTLRKKLSRKSLKATNNGVGFNDANIASFETLDSDHKIDKGCRGIGRLLWLKAFDIAK